MVERATIINPFFRDLFDSIAPEIDRRMVALAGGSAKQVAGSTQTVAEAYAAECGYIQALNEVLEICAQLEHNQHGNRPELNPSQQEEQ